MQIKALVAAVAALAIAVGFTLPSWGGAHEQAPSQIPLFELG